MTSLLAAAWGLPQPVRLEQTAAGTNNLSRVVDTPAGAYVLRVYQNTTDPAALRYEHAVLRLLRGQDLSFAVPQPVPTRTGATFVTAGDLSGQPLVALCPLIPGRRPAKVGPTEAAVCGAALAELDFALARIEGELPVADRPMFGDLARIHALVPDPRQMVNTLPLPADLRQQADRILQQLLDAVPTLYARLPRQVIHGDFWPSNLLLVGGRVSGVLDFEFAGPDLRAMDLAVAMTAFRDEVDGSGREAAVVQALGDAYRRRWPLTAEEVEALPVLMRLQRAVSLIHRAGRMRQGLAGEDAVHSRVVNLVALDAWLASHDVPA